MNYFQWAVFLLSPINGLLALAFFLHYWKRLNLIIRLGLGLYVAGTFTIFYAFGSGIDLPISPSAAFSQPGLLLLFGGLLFRRYRLVWMLRKRQDRKT